MKIISTLLTVLAVAAATQAKEIKLLNVSYDPTRELCLSATARGAAGSYELKEIPGLPRIHCSQTNLDFVQSIARLSVMRLSKRGEYALRALINLGVARELGRPLLQISELAEKDNLPIKFLEAILVELKSHGYVDSKRGKHGGYFIKQAMDTIRIGTIVRDMEGPLAPIGCVSQNFYERCSCPDEAYCGLRMLMLDVRNAISDILDKHTLAEVVADTLKKCRRDKIAHPFACKPTKGKE